MANENTILTALGLDLSQFESGTRQAVSSTKPLLGALATIDTQLRQLPILGTVYSATLGQIAQGFAETRLQARAFGQTMQTDVSGSLEGTINQIDEINGQLKELKEGSFAKTTSGFLTNFFKSTTGTDKDPFVQVEKQIAALESKKTQNVQNVIGLLQQESAAHSSIISGSELESENARSYLEMRQKILSVVQQAQKIGGPDSAKWNSEIQKSVGDQANLYIEIYNKQVQVATLRRQTQAEEFKTAAKIADLQAHSNEREIAQAEEKLAIIKATNAQEAGVKEEIAAAQAELAIAHSRSEQVQHQYELEVKQLSIETKIMAAQVTGQTRLAQQLEIQARYQIQIDEALRKGNVELAKQLQAQQKLSQLELAIKQYELGGRGRATQRAQERHARRTARVVQSRLTERELDQKVDETGLYGLNSNGLRSGGLTSGGLARPKPAERIQQQIPLEKSEQFMRDVLNALTK